MSTNITLTEKEQENILSYISLSLKEYTGQATLYHEQMLKIYESLSTFEMPDTGDNLTKFKINKAHEVLRKVVPRVISNPPKMIVTPRTDVFEDEDKEKLDPTSTERQDMLSKHNMYAMALQEYLNALYSDQNFKERLKLWVVNQLTYGNAFADVVPKYKIQRTKDRKTKKITETVIGVMPTIDIVSWTEINYDARYKLLEDMPGVIRVRRGVRLLDLIASKKYFNLDKLEKIANTNFSDTDGYSSLIFQVTGISGIELKAGIDKNSLNVQEAQIRYSITGEAKHEKLYKITTINSAIVIGIDEITEISIVDIKGHEDPEVFYSVGLIAPILGITDELNFQKNAQATAMAKSLHRSYLWAPESGVDPSQLVNDVAGNIIVCSDGVEQAKRHFEEQVDRQLPSQYFSNINDYNRDIQTLSHTTDVSQPGGQGALTNTATGARISFFESNSVVAELRKNFEKGVAELSYKILDFLYNNIEDDIVLKKSNSKEFLKINIEAVKDAVSRYNIVVEANSSSFDDLENRRADAIALKNLLMEAANAGANVDIDEGFRRVFSTFEQIDVDKLMPKKQEGTDSVDMLQGGQGQLPTGKPAEKSATPTTPAELTSAVAGGSNLFDNQ